MRRIETPARGEAIREQTRKLLRASANVGRGPLALNAPHATRSPLPVRRCFVTAHQFAKAARILRRTRMWLFQTRVHNVLSCRCRNREGVVHRLADSRTEVVEPFFRMAPVHDTPNKSKLACNVATVPTDVLSCCCG